MRSVSGFPTYCRDGNLSDFPNSSNGHQGIGMKNVIGLNDEGQLVANGAGAGHPVAICHRSPITWQPGRFAIRQLSGNSGQLPPIQRTSVQPSASGRFLQFNERDLLEHPGKVTAEIAKAFAESEFEKYRVVQDRLFESDFDRAVKAIAKGK
jgi:hypothetical protein